MKKFLLLVVLVNSFSALRAQKVDSIYFHLYTDSLKKGQHNYINIDGKLSNGKWMPLTTKDVSFQCSEATFEGNQLIIPENFKPEKVTITAFLKSNPLVIIERTIWIKTKPDGPLPTKDEIMKDIPSRKTKNKG